MTERGEPRLPFDQPPVRTTDPETSWDAWRAIAPTYARQCKKALATFRAVGRHGYTYSELAEELKRPGVSTSTMISKLERGHCIVRKRWRGKPHKRKGVGTTHKQKVMIHRNYATEEEVTAHLLLAADKGWL